MPRFSRHIGIEPVFVWFGQVAAPMHCEFRLQCESHCEQDMGTEKSRALSSILVCVFVLSFCHSILSLFCLFRWLFAHFNYYYQMRNNISFEIKHQFHFQVIYTFCSIKRIANPTLGEKNVYCSVFNILFNSFCYSFSLYMRHTRNHRANPPFKCEFLFIICSVIPYFPSRGTNEKWTSRFGNHSIQMNERVTFLGANFQVTEPM